MRKSFGPPPSAISDQSKPDANAPQDDPGSDNPMGTPEPYKADCVYLSKEQLAAAGLNGLDEGQTFTTEITGTVTKKKPDGSVEADITDASEGEVQTGGTEPGGDDDGNEPDEFQAPKGRVEMSPKGMKGF